MSTPWQCTSTRQNHSALWLNAFDIWRCTLAPIYMLSKEKKISFRRIQMFHSEPITNMYGVFLSFKCARLMQVLPLRAASSSRVLPRALVCQTHILNYLADDSYQIWHLNALSLSPTSAVLGVSGEGAEGGGWSFLSHLVWCMTDSC